MQVIFRSFLENLNFLHNATYIYASYKFNTNMNMYVNHKVFLVCTIKLYLILSPCIKWLYKPVFQTDKR